MNRTVFMLVAALFLIAVGLPAEAEVDDAAREAITRAAMDYMDGAHAGDAARMERAVHPELTKVTVVKLPNGRDVLHKAGSSRLVEMIRSGGAPVPEADRNIALEIFAVREGLAAARITSSVFYDYLLLADIDGSWKIINVLWKMNPEWVEKNRPEALEGKEPFDADAEKKAIEAAALDYLEGYYTGDSERMARGIHPELTKVWPRKHPKTGGTYLDRIGSGYLIEATALGGGKLEEGKRDINMTIFDYGDDIAFVEALSAMFYDYLQMAKVNGEWKVVNVLWVMNPDAPKG